MNLTEIAATISAFAALGGLITSLINRRGIQNIHVSINSRMDELLRKNSLLARAEGREENRLEQKGNS